MAAYAALVSLMQTIHQIEHHPSPPISMDKKQVESLTEIVMFLQEFLESYKSPFAEGDEADPLEMRIADAIYAAEDAIELRIVDQLVPAASASAGSSTSADLYESLVKVIEDMYLIKKQVMEIKDQQTQVVSASSSASTKSSSPSGLKSTVMVGFDDVMLQLMDKLTDGRVGRQVIPIVGMGGIGKTTLARNVYEKMVDSCHFDICAWVTISLQYNTKELFCEILSQANKQGKERLSQMREDEIGVSLHKFLSYRRYLIVLDDMWNIEAWEKLQRYFPDNSNGSRVMVTTRLSNLGSQLDNNCGLEMKFMDEVSGWNMFCKIVFREKSCPLELEKIGKKIVKSCKGLPLSIVVMGGLLETMEQTKECWESIRRSMSSLVNLENDKHCLKILKLSYNHLPVYLKPCFLYLGMFEEDSRIRVSRVVELWVSEGFIKPTRGKSLETIAKEYMDELADRNLILVHELGSGGNLKWCKIHDLLRDLCLKEAERERFYDVVGQHSSQGTCSQRRVFILESTSEEKVVDAIKSRPYARTCICAHERGQPLPSLKLLRTLRVSDGYYSNQYSFGKLFEFVNLRLLAICFDIHSSQIPSSMNLLWSLQTLIVSSRVQSVNAPVEIWNMSQLRHVKVKLGAGHLPTPPPSDKIVIMENLQTLIGVRNFKCDEMMLRRIPNIKKMKLHFDYDMGIEYSGDHDFKHLQELESLTCHWFPRGDLSPKLTFPHSLKSLTLDMARGCRMEDIMEKVTTLPLLQKLTLIGGDFTTGEWETVEDQFRSLKYLYLSCGHLECWTMESSHFPCLEHLSLCSMHDLKEIPAEVGEIPTLKSLTIVNCSESVVKSAKRMVEEQEELQGEDQLSFQVTVHLYHSDDSDEDSDEDNDELLKLATPNFKVV